MNASMRAAPGYGTLAVLLTLFALPCAGAAAQEDPASAASKARYAAACTYLEGEMARLDAMVARSMPADRLLRHDPASGARLYRRQAKDARIDYLVLADGKRIVSQAELGPHHLGLSLTAPALQRKLGLDHPLPPTFQTGCDGWDMQARTRGTRLLGMTISVHID